MTDDFSELDRQRRAAEGLRRTRRMMIPSPSRRDAPLPSSEPGARLELVEVDGASRYRLDGTWVVEGDVVQLYTNRVNRWLRGRFEWTGQPDDPPQLVMNLWDPTAPAEEEGLVPWVGEIRAALPAGAILRWPI